MASALFESLIDLLVPPRGSERLVRTLTLERLQQRMHEDGLPYHDPAVTALIWEVKYYANSRAVALCGTLLAEMLLAAAAEEIGTPLLVPVPMHPARRRARGHNQTELLCKAALRELRKASLKKVIGSPVRAPASKPGRPDFFYESFSTLEYAPRALERAVDTKTQQGLPRSERLHNVAKSMVALPALVAGRACVVVDDVTTTGATLAEAKRALRIAGARAVTTVALARS